MNISQKQVSEWKDITPSNYLCTLPYCADKVGSVLQISFERVVEDGLDLMDQAFIAIDHHELLLKSPNDGISDHNVFVYMKGTEAYPLECLDLLLKVLNIPRDKLLDVNPDLGEAKWSLTRLDDNGNEIEMFRFMNKEHAFALQNYFDEKKHKQHYFVRDLISLKTKS